MKIKDYLLVLCFFVCIKAASTQCTVVPFSVPNPAAGAIAPKDIHFCEGDIVSNIALQVLPLSEFLYGGTLFQIDSFVLNYMTPMPAWMDYVCYDPQCLFRAGIWSCIALNVTGGVPGVVGPDSVNLYRITFNVMAWARAGGVPVSMNVVLTDTVNLWVHRIDAFRWWDNRGYLYQRLSGQIYLDSNENGIMDGTERYIAGQRVLILPDSLYLITNTRGQYQTVLDTGNYSVEYVPTNFLRLSSPVGNYNFRLDTAHVVIPDIGIKGIDTSVISLCISSGVMRCSQDVPHIVSVINEGTRIENCLLEFRKDHRTFFSAANPHTDSIQTGENFWHIRNLHPGEIRNYAFNLWMPGVPAIGDTIVSTSLVCFRQLFVADTLRRTLVCAYDPNDKEVYPFGNGPEKYTLMSEKLRYTIHFQNTGNDTAFNIAIRDTLSPDIDLNSFRVLASSHNLNTGIKTDGSVLFSFDNILLPDSGRSQLLSQGFLTYTVKPKLGLPNNTRVENTAYIFFDHNPAIQTNTTLNTLVYNMPVSIHEANVSIENNLIVYPNPSDGQVSIILPQENKTFILQIFNSQGQIIYSSCTSLKEVSVNMHTPGIYLVKVSCGKEVISSKLMVN